MGRRYILPWLNVLSNSRLLITFQKKYFPKCGCYIIVHRVNPFQAPAPSHSHIKSQERNELDIGKPKESSREILSKISWKIYTAKKKLHHGWFSNFADASVLIQDGLSNGTTTQCIRHYMWCNVCVWRDNCIIEINCLLTVVCLHGKTCSNLHSIVLVSSNLILQAF